MGKGKIPKPSSSARPRRSTCPPRGQVNSQFEQSDVSESITKARLTENNDPPRGGINRRKSVNIHLGSQAGPSRLSKPFQVVFNYIPTATTKSTTSREENFDLASSEGNNSGESNDPLFIGNPEAIDEDPIMQILPDDPDEYIEETVYVDLDEIPNIQELFSIRPDDHLLLQNRRQREKPVVPKPTASEVTLKFYNLESDKPVLRLGKTFYTGGWQDSVGSSLFFNKQDKGSVKIKNFEFVHLLNEGKNSKLDNLIPEKPKTPLDEIKPDPVFKEKEPSSSFDLVGNVKKILKLTRRDLSGAEASYSSRVIHDDARFMPSYYIDKEMRNKVEILQLLGKHKDSPEDFKFKWKLEKGKYTETLTEVQRRLKADDAEWEDISESDLSEDEGSSSSCDEVDEEAYEAYLKIREELNYETKNFNFNNKKGKAVEASQSFKERYSAPYYLNRRKVVTRVNSMLTRANMKKINCFSPTYKKKRSTTLTDVEEKKEDHSESTMEHEEIVQSTANSISTPSPVKNRNERFYRPTFSSKEELFQKWKPAYSSNSSIKSTTTRLLLPEELKELLKEASVESENESTVTAETCEKMKTLNVSKKTGKAE